MRGTHSPSSSKVNATAQRAPLGHGNCAISSLSFFCQSAPQAIPFDRTRSVQTMAALASMQTHLATQWQRTTSQAAAVDAEHRSGNEGRLGRGEVEHGARDV